MHPTALIQGCLHCTGRLLCYLLLTGLAVSSQAQQPAEPLPVAVPVDVIEDYERFLGPRDPLAISDFSGPFSRRDVVELILLQQALHLGGFGWPLTFIPETSYRRVIRQMAAGQLISTGASKWHLDLASAGDALLISDALVENGEFIVGIYTLATHRHIQQAEADQLRQWRIISNQHWRADVHTLQALGFRRITYGGDWPSMVRMLDAGRGELVLAPFPNRDDLSIEVNGSRLLPVEHIRVAISGSRHWAVSRKHPQGPAFFAALQRGLAQLRLQGVVERAYRQSGFFNAQTDQWPILKLVVSAGGEPAVGSPPAERSAEGAQ